MLTLNAEILTRVIAQARADAAAHPRWITAINRAARELESNPWIEREHGGLLIGSPSGQVYSANGVCGCCAFTGMDEGVQVHAGGLPCWHRAAARIVRRYDEAVVKQETGYPTCEVCHNAAATLIATPPNNKQVAICGGCRYGDAIIPEGTAFKRYDEAVAQQVVRPSYEVAVAELLECF